MGLSSTWPPRTVGEPRSFNSTIRATTAPGSADGAARRATCHSDSSVRTCTEPVSDGTRAARAPSASRPNPATTTAADTPTSTVAAADRHRPPAADTDRRGASAGAETGRTGRGRAGASNPRGRRMPAKGPGRATDTGTARDPRRGTTFSVERDPSRGTIASTARGTRRPARPGPVGIGPAPPGRVGTRRTDSRAAAFDPIARTLASSAPDSPFRSRLDSRVDR